MTSSMPRLRFSLQFDGEIAAFASVTAAKPSCRPVRREVFSTSGVERRIFSMCCRIRSDSAKELPGGVK